MISKKNYSNGQKAQELSGNKLTYFFKNGKVKAEGLLINDKMEGDALVHSCEDRGATLKPSSSRCNLY